MPAELIDSIAIAGPADYVRGRLGSWASAGVTLLLAAIQAPTQEQRLRTIEIVAAGAPSLA